MLDPENDWSLAQRIDDVLPRLSERLGERVAGETHGSAVELSTDPHATVGDAVDQVHRLRATLSQELAAAGLRAASAGTHPFAVWSEMQIAGGDRHQAVYGSMRELARREPTFALHVHIGVGDPERAINLHNRLRGHLALLLALATNSPFWQGRNTGLASARIPIFQAFPRVGVPRQFADYSEYVETVDLLLRCGAFPEPTYLWWDLRPQPKFGTVEVRVMDVQTRASATGPLIAHLQSIASLELERVTSSPTDSAAPRCSPRIALSPPVRNPRQADRPDRRTAHPRHRDPRRPAAVTHAPRRPARLPRVAGGDLRCRAGVWQRRTAARPGAARLTPMPGRIPRRSVLRADDPAKLKRKRHMTRSRPPCQLCPPPPRRAHHDPTHLSTADTGRPSLP